MGRSSTAHMLPTPMAAHRAGGGGIGGGIGGGLGGGRGGVPGTPGTPMSTAGYSPAVPRTIRRTGAADVIGIGLPEADELMDIDNTFALDADEDLQLQQQLAVTRIWGTDVSVESARNVFRTFVNYYGVQDGSVEDGRLVIWIVFVFIICVYASVGSVMCHLVHCIRIGHGVNSPIPLSIALIV